MSAKKPTYRELANALATALDAFSRHDEQLDAFMSVHDASRTEKRRAKEAVKDADSAREVLQRATVEEAP